MKKKFKKLQKRLLLDKETIIRLNAEQLDNLAGGGGYQATTPVSSCDAFTCMISCQGDTTEEGQDVKPQ